MFESANGARVVVWRLRKRECLDSGVSGLPNQMTGGWNPLAADVASFRRLVERYQRPRLTLDTAKGGEG
jgi:hypothetical protein